MPKFLHIADPHIDSPVAAVPGWTEGHGGRSLTRTAFAKAVELAIDEAVDLVVIAGDLFDGDHQHAGTWQWTRSQLLRLTESGVPVVFLRGNHDAKGSLSAAFNWPDRFFELPVDRPGRVTLDDVGLAVVGQGYAERDVYENLAATYPDADGDLFHIGLLHTSFGGESKHAPYAPAAPADLLRRNYGYWALGHVHKPTAIADAREHGVPILFAGNPQGRDVGECGPRGAVLVKVDGGEATPEFVPLDSLRWSNETVSADGCVTTEDLVGTVLETLRQVDAASGGRDSAVRIEVTGPFEGHAEIDDIAGKAVFESRIRDHDDQPGRVHVESVRVCTSPPVDIDRLMREGGLLADVLAEFDRAIAEAEGGERPAPAGKLFDDAEADRLLDGVRETLSNATLDADTKRLGVAFTAEDHARWLRAARARLIAELTAA